MKVGKNVRLLKVRPLVWFVLTVSVAAIVWLAAWGLALWVLPSDSLKPAIGAAVVIIVGVSVGIKMSFVATIGSELCVRNLAITRRIEIGSVVEIDRIHLSPVLGQVDMYFLRVRGGRRSRLVPLIATCRFERSPDDDVKRWLTDCGLAKKLKEMRRRSS